MASAQRVRDSRGETLSSILGAALRAHSAKRVIFPALNHSFSYEELLMRAQAAARALVKHGARRGELVGLLAGNSPEFLLGLLGVVFSGAALVPLPHRSPGKTQEAYMKHLLSVLRDGNVRRVLVEESVSSALEPVLAQEGIVCLPIERLTASPGESGCLPVLPVLPVLAPSELALVQYTSGSTANPKGVALSHRNVVAGIRAIVHGSGLCEADTLAQWLPLHHDMGLIGTLSSISVGATVQVSSPLTFIRNPASWLERFSATRATVFVGPNFSYASLLAKVSDEQLRELDLSSWRISYNGAEVIDAPLTQRFIARFSAAGLRRGVMFPVYGLAELTLAATFSAPGEDVRVEWVDRSSLANGSAIRSVAHDHPAVRGLVAVGKPVLGHELRIADDAGEPLGERRVGEILLRGPAMMASYWQKTPAESGITEDGWLRTGDLGAISDGQLFVTGRRKEMMILRGSNFYPRDVEAVVEGVPTVGSARAVAFAVSTARGERMVVLVEAGPHQHPQIGAQIREAILAELGLSEVEVCVVAPRSIACTSSGKYQRLLMRERYLSGALKFTGAHTAPATMQGS